MHMVALCALFTSCFVLPQKASGMAGGPSARCHHNNILSMAISNFVASFVKWAEGRS
jgi:hypothetical protein